MFEYHFRACQQSEGWLFRITDIQKQHWAGDFPSGKFFLVKCTPSSQVRPMPVATPCNCFLLFYKNIWNFVMSLHCFPQGFFFLYLCLDFTCYRRSYCKCFYIYICIWAACNHGLCSGMSQYIISTLVFLLLVMQPFYSQFCHSSLCLVMYSIIIIIFRISTLSSCIL